MQCKAVLSRGCCFDAKAGKNLMLPRHLSNGSSKDFYAPEKFTSNRLKGLQFEEMVVTLMKSLNCNLRATQQTRDGGIDHQGTWILPDVEVDVVTQCKNESKPVGVPHIRAFQGVLNLSPPNSLGLFSSASGYTLFAHRFFLRMTHPAILCTIDLNSRSLTAFLINSRARALLPKLTVGSLFANQEHVLVLTYGDKILG